MLKLFLTLIVLVSAGLAQSSSDGSFSVRHSKRTNFSLGPTEMRQAENLYSIVCAVVKHDFNNGAGELHPRFTVVIGTERNEVHTAGLQADHGFEIWMKKWNPTVFAQGVVVVAFDQMLTRDVITQLGNRAIRYSNATVDVTDFK
jgi:hypothetical protein